MEWEDAEKIRADLNEWETEYRDRIFKCPFCFSPLVCMEGIETPFGDTVDGGLCGCGASFVYDRSGRRLGEAYMNALAMAYGWDYDAAVAGSDGECDEAVARYESRVGKFLLGDGGSMDRNPKYCFVRLRRPRS